MLIARILSFADLISSPQMADTLQDEALLRYYAREWERFTTGANYINRLFTYLNRHWVKRERDEGRKNIYPVYTVSRPTITADTGILMENVIASISTVEVKSIHSDTGKTNEARFCRASNGRSTTEWF